LLQLLLLLLQLLGRWLCTLLPMGWLRMVDELPVLPGVCSLMLQGSTQSQPAA
jgi:hypothetical protein